MTMNFQGDWARFLEADPQGRQSLYNASLPGGINRNQQSYLQTLYEPTYNEWLGNLGKRLLSGQGPDENATLAQFFGGKDWTRELARQPGLNSTQSLFGRGGFDLFGGR